MTNPPKTDLKAEHTQLKEKINVLKNKVEILECSESPAHSSSPFAQMLREDTQRELYVNNVLVHGFSEPSSSSYHQRIDDYKTTLEQILGHHKNIIPNSAMNFIHLGKVRPDHVHRLKIIFLSKEDQISFLRGCNEAKLNSSEFPVSFLDCQRKTAYERGLTTVIPNSNVGLSQVKLFYK
ncbi:unnamed protein product [Macrosiphum euphorbiae]|uniref:Uncharacterized protein n=1 Tax=Macrosiphum euphorbiae TaxID=13131 RepID=A0AAV0WMP3_9HEMI|nr:unnamed protein product [Macrosiphum euphorbiae]